MWRSDILNKDAGHRHAGSTKWDIGRRWVKDIYMNL